MKKLFKKLFGFEEIEKKISDLNEKENKINNLHQKLEERENELEKEKQSIKEKEEELDQELNGPSEKEKATKKGEPWVKVVDTHVNYEDIRNGFFELDWNEVFVEELKYQGYGEHGDPEEEIVDRWFRHIVAEMLEYEGYDPSQAAGHLNIIRNNR